MLQLAACPEQTLDQIHPRRKRFQLHQLHQSILCKRDAHLNGSTCWLLLQMKDDALDGNKAAAEAAAQRGNLLMTALWSIVGGGRAAESAGGGH